jgi:hypothetical protein
MSDVRYPPETLPDDEDDGTMLESLAELESAVVGHRIISAVPGGWNGTQTGLVLTLDNGTQAILRPISDCCAYTEVESFLLHPEAVNHMILGVGTTDGYNTWHVYADFGDILKLTVDWSCGNPFYYGYGFDIQVVPVNGGNPPPTSVEADGGS